MTEPRIVLITGAAGGLGQTAAHALAAQGYQLILLDKRLKGLEQLYDQLLTYTAPTPLLHGFDLASAQVEHYQELAEHIAQRFGKLDGLLHSAALFTAFAPLASQDLVEWNQTFNTNLHAPYLLTRVLLECLVNSGSASVLFTCDHQARKPQPYSGAFGVALSALEALVKMWSDELDSDPRIRLNLLLPGAVDSPLRRRGYPGEPAEARTSAALLAPLYPYLLGPDSAHLRGQVIDAQTFSWKQTHD
ncbi:MAG: SDR family NAD(P)-dependent oxidoreductase [Methylococcales bacterium]|nr:SDR family NAD(P)-dependent oxidoreductase [Methylococcales bacterium]